MNKSGILRKENTICVSINTFATLLIYFRVYLFTYYIRFHKMERKIQRDSPF